MEEALEATVATDMDVSASFDDYDTMVTYFKDKIEGIQKNTLEICWEIGYEVNLIKKAAVYGQKTVDNFAISLDIAGMDTKRLYRYAQFASEYTKVELNNVLQKRHVGWGAINKLLTVKDKEDRQEFEDKLDSEEIRPSDLDDELSLYKSKLEPGEGGGEGELPETTTPRTNRSYMKNFKKGTITAEILKNIIPSALQDITDLGDIADKDDQYNKALDAIYSFREIAEELSPLLNTFVEEALKIA